MAATTIVPTPTGADLDAWKDALARLADGLDLTDRADRDRFHMRVRDLAAAATVHDLRAVLVGLGFPRTVPLRSRVDNVRQIATTWAGLSPADRRPASATATDEQRRAQAEYIACLATALADGTVIGPRRAAVALLEEAVALLRAWTPDDRGAAPGTHLRAGSDSARQSVGLPGHCDRCAAVGHVRAHPDLGCGDVGCTAAHPDDRADDRA